MSIVLAVLARAWASPGTILGLLLGATTLTAPRTRDGVLVFTSPRGAARALRRLGFEAITLGHVITTNRDLGDPLWNHELVHVRQWEVLGPVMLLAYPVASIAGYRRNPFEVAARRRAGA